VSARDDDDDIPPTPPGKARVSVHFTGGFSLTLAAEVTTDAVPGQTRNVLFALRDHDDHLDLTTYAANGERIATLDIFTGMVESHMADVVARFIEITADDEWHVHASGDERRPVMLQRDGLVN
jgi:hypothetical protein